MTGGRLSNGWRCEIFETIDSTNEEARRRAEAGEAGPLWLLAHRQTAGRGRRGRSWDSPTGNLMATLLWRPPVDLQQAGTLSFVAALSVADLVADRAAGDVRLKWPNDVLIEGAKVAGILLESAAEPGSDRLAWIAIGIGVNLRWAPEGTPYPATTVAAYGGTAPEPEAALEILAGAFERWSDLWLREGFAPIRAAWLARAKGVGEAIEVRLPAETLHGRFAGLDASGALLLEGEGALTKPIAAGEVFWG